MMQVNCASPTINQHQSLRAGGWIDTDVVGPEPTKY